MLASFDRNAHFETGVRRVHIYLEFGRALRVARKAFRRGHPFGLTADREALDAYTVQPDIDLMRLSQSHDVVVKLAAQQDFDRVLAVGREVMADGRPA